MNSTAYTTQYIMEMDIAENLKITIECAGWTNIKQDRRP